MRDAQLYGRQLQRADDGLLIIGVARVYHAAQHAPNKNISPRYNLGTGIYVAEHDYIACMMYRLAGTDGAPKEEGILRLTRIFLCLQLSLGLVGRFLKRQSDCLCLSDDLRDLLKRPDRHLIVCKQIFELDALAYTQMPARGIYRQRGTTKKGRCLRQSIG